MRVQRAWRKFNNTHQGGARCGNPLAGVDEKVAQALAEFLLDDEGLVAQARGIYLPMIAEHIRADMHDFAIVMGNSYQFKAGVYVVAGNAHVELRGTAMGWFLGNATGVLTEHATGAVSGTSVTVHGNAEIDAFLNATVRARENAVVRLYGNQPTCTSDKDVRVERLTV